MFERHTVRDVGLAMLIGALASLPAAPGPRTADHPVAFESETGRALVREAEADRTAEAVLAAAGDDRFTS